MNVLSLCALLSFLPIATISASSQPPAEAQAFQPFDAEQSAIQAESEMKRDGFHGSAARRSSGGLTSMSSFCRETRRRIVARIDTRCEKSVLIVQLMAAAGSDERYFPGNDDEPLSDICAVDLTGKEKPLISSIALAGHNKFTIGLEEGDSDKTSSVPFTISPTSLWQWYVFHNFDQKLTLDSTEFKQICLHKSDDSSCVIM